MLELLDNVMWHSLAGAQAALAQGTLAARRYAPGYSPIIGFAQPEDPSFEDLRPFCQPQEKFYCSGWSGRAPAGWRVEADARMVQMVWAGATPEAGLQFKAAPLGPEHATQAMDLASLTRPGPFGPRTLEMGAYFGCFEGPRLVAMAGERMHAGLLREISGVCTHPEYQGRGLARRLMEKLIALQRGRGQTPFLHVMSGNEGARSLYRRMGFREHREVVVRVVSRE